MRGQLKIDLLGQSFEINADTSDEHLKQMYEKYTAWVDHTKHQLKQTDPIRIAIVAGLFLADELYREKEKIAHLEATRTESPSSDVLLQIQESTRRMLNSLDSIPPTV